ncbi:DedA family protein [Nesterenkonia halobia]|uniref:VTT domain-containing protein n=1 Tax=Nesterenkonia halobia TaxID=37922 RepID=A0ABP6RCG4_9MICC
MGPGELLDTVNEAVLDAASGWWTLLGLLFFCIVDGFFPVVPSDSLVVGLGSLLGEPGTPPWFGVVLVAAGGALLGDIIAHRLGRLIGTERFGWMRRPTPRRTFTWARHELDKRGVLLIFVGRFIPGGRVGINFVAGATGYSFRRFVVIDAGASLLWAAYTTAIGLVGGQLFDSVLISMVVSIGGAVVLGWIFDRVFRRFTAWLDRRGVHLDPEGYQDLGELEVEAPVHLPHRRQERPAPRRRRRRPRNGPGRR